MILSLIYSIPSTAYLYSISPSDHRRRRIVAASTAARDKSKGRCVRGSRTASRGGRGRGRRGGGVPEGYRIYTPT